jgi:hypothetical protein
MKRILVPAIVAAAAWVCGAKVQERHGPPLPKPGPQHEHLKKYEGAWDVTIKMEKGPFVSESKGVERCAIACGGLWLVAESEGDMGGGVQYQGRGLYGYDPLKKKHVGVWVDNMTPGLTLLEGDLESGGKKRTMIAKGADPTTGQVGSYSEVTEWQDDDTRVLRMSAPGTAGQPFMTLTYRRRK